MGVHESGEATTSRSTKRVKERLHPGVVERGLETRSREVGKRTARGPWQAQDDHRLEQLYRKGIRSELVEVGGRIVQGG